MNTRDLRNRWDGLLSRVAKAKNLQQQQAYLALRDIQDMNGDLCKYGDVLDPQNEDGQRFLGNLFKAEQCCLIQLTTHGLQHAAALLDAPAMEDITALANAVVGCTSSIGCKRGSVKQQNSCLAKVSHCRSRALLCMLAGAYLLD